MQITGYTTQSSLIRLWTYTSSLFSPKPSAGDATERKRSNGSWKLIYRLRNPFKESSVWVPVCTADSSQRERTGNHRGKAGMERPSFPLPLLPWGRSLEAGKQQCPLSGWHWSMPPPSRVKRQAPGKVKAFGGALVDRWVEAISGELVGQEGTSSPDHNSRDLLLWRTLSLPLPRLTMRGPS